MCVFTVCEQGACPLSHLAACGFFHELLNEGKNTPSCPQECSPGGEPSPVLVFPLTLLRCPNSPSFTLFSAERADVRARARGNTLLCLHFFSISLSFPVRTCVPLVARLRVHKHENTQRGPKHEYALE